MERWNTSVFWCSLYKLLKKGHYTAHSFVWPLGWHDYATYGSANTTDYTPAVFQSSTPYDFMSPNLNGPGFRSDRRDSWHSIVSKCCCLLASHAQHHDDRRKLSGNRRPVPGRPEIQVPIPIRVRLPPRARRTRILRFDQSLFVERIWVWFECRRYASTEMPKYRWRRLGDRSWFCKQPDWRRTAPWRSSK